MYADRDGTSSELHMENSHLPEVKTIWSESYYQIFYCIVTRYTP
jgi:hypothetical protein